MRAAVDLHAPGLPPDQVAGSHQRIGRAVELHQEAERQIDEGLHREGVETLLAARRTLSSAYYPLFAPRSPELRGVYVQHLVYVTDWESVCRTLDECGFNAVLPYVANGGLAHYPSELLEQTPIAKRPDDALHMCIRAAHQHGIEVHAWRNPLSLLGATREVRERLDATGRTMVSARGEKLPALCPNIPENRELEVSACAELLQEYDIDGIHLDYLRYPNWPPSQCYCQACRKLFATDTGLQVDEWPGAVLGDLKQDYLLWGTSVITRLLADIRAELHAVRPEVRVSAAIFGWPGTRAKVGQEPDEWLDRHLIDFACFMNYTENNESFASWISEQVALVNGRVPCYAVIGAFSHAAWFDSPVQLIDQVNISRERGANGFIVAQLYETLLDEFLPALAEGVTSAPATIPGEQAAQRGRRDRRALEAAN